VDKEQNVLYTEKSSYTKTDYFLDHCPDFKGLMWARFIVALLLGGVTLLMICFDTTPYKIIGAVFFAVNLIALLTLISNLPQMIRPVPFRIKYKGEGQVVKYAFYDTYVVSEGEQGKRIIKKTYKYKDIDYYVEDGDYLILMQENKDGIVLYQPALSDNTYELVRNICTVKKDHITSNPLKRVTVSNLVIVSIVVCWFFNLLICNLAVF